MKRRPMGEVELPITPMLDMAFQLLTFFILTFQPAPVEGQFAMKLLPAPGAGTQVQTTPPPDVPDELKTIPVALYATEDGRLARASIAGEDTADLADLAGRIREMAQDPALAFDRGRILVDPRLKYAEMVRVVDAFLAAGVTQVSFDELSGAQ
jgi:biopolymer transport protein ExbD